MLGTRAQISLPLALFGAAAFTILAGASFNIQGQTADAAIFALLAGVLAFGAGVAWRYWKYAAGAGAIAVVVEALTHHFHFDRYFFINLAGLAALGVGGMLFTLGYQKMTEQIRQRVVDLEALNARLEEQHRIFLAATEDPTLHSASVAELAANTARQTSSAICCYYLAGPDGSTFVPQEGVGLEGVELCEHAEQHGHAERDRDRSEQQPGEGLPGRPVASVTVNGRDARLTYSGSPRELHITEGETRYHLSLGPLGRLLSVGGGIRRSWRAGGGRCRGTPQPLRRG